MLIGGIWQINQNGPLPKAMKTKEHAGEIWSLFGLSKADGEAWFLQQEEKGWTSRYGPMEDPRYECAFRAHKFSEANKPAEPKRDLSGLVQGGSLTNAGDFLPKEVFSNLDFNPQRGVTTPSVDDAINVLALYGVTESLARSTYSEILSKGWPNGNRLDRIKAIGADLKSEAKRSTVASRPALFSYSDM